MNRPTLNPFMSRKEPGFSLFAMLAAFLTYSSMYAFRKPFTAAAFEDLSIWGVDYKIVLILTQVLGYMLSKFIGIKVISEMLPGSRIRSLLLLIGIAWGALLLFGLLPYPYNFICLFFNGLPLGMIWGIVFSFLEGRRTTELLGAGMSVSFIVSSGLVKAVGKALMLHAGVSAFWMPFLAALVFVPTLLLGVWMLQQLPPPSREDEALRTVRVPMQGPARREFFRAFAPGIVLMVAIYVALTIFRDLRDNFAVELWDALGFGGQAQILLSAEVPIAISVLVIVALMMLIRSNKLAFFANQAIIFTGGLSMVVTTWLFNQGMISPAAWMISVGFGMYLAYISYHTMLFERWIALFRYKSNIGYLMYLADAFGYLGSVGILLFRHFGAGELSWLAFFNASAYATGCTILVLVTMSTLYFWSRYQAMKRSPASITGLPV